MDTLQIEPVSYVEDDLKLHYSDVVYRLDLKANKGCAYIYALVEHQSKAEEFMPLRIIKYQLAIIQQHLNTHKGSMRARESEEFKQLLTQINQEIPDFKDSIMTYAEELIQKGEQRGIHLGEKKGRQEGIQEGIQRAQQEIATKLLDSGMAADKVAECVGIPLEKLAKLCKH